MTAKRISTNKRLNDDYDNLFLSASAYAGIDPKILKAVAMNESGPRFEFMDKWEPVGGTIGILHVQFETAKDYAPNLTREEWLKPQMQISIAAQHIARLMKVFNNDLGKVIMAYNAGEGRIQSGVVPSVTRDYLERFWRNYNRLGVA